MTFISIKKKMNSPPNPLMVQYQPPTGRKEVDRWHYPEVDYGLLGSFVSQKAKFLELEEINRKLSQPRRLNAEELLMFVALWIAVSAFRTRD